MEYSPVVGDWIQVLDKDKQQLWIYITGDNIQTVSIYKFKQFVKKKATELMIQLLLALQLKHSKSKYLDVDLEISSYLIETWFNKNGNGNGKGGNAAVIYQ